MWRDLGEGVLKIRQFHERHMFIVPYPLYEINNVYSNAFNPIKIGSIKLSCLVSVHVQICYFIDVFHVKYLFGSLCTMTRYFGGEKMKVVNQ